MEGGRGVIRGVTCGLFGYGGDDKGTPGLRLPLPVLPLPIDGRVDGAGGRDRGVSALASEGGPAGNAPSGSCGPCSAGGGGRVWMSAGADRTLELDSSAVDGRTAVELSASGSGLG